MLGSGLMAGWDRREMAIEERRRRIGREKKEGRLTIEWNRVARRGALLGSAWHRRGIRVER